ncbi:MAG TPA: DNA/RNA nuclease SfsA [Alphaproteobacteria bacterium]|nr:DNA/RNA nuclease SfsA [Alphaproteobacteria bacterium]
MLFPAPLRPARLIRRYKRFLADVDLGEGPPVTVYCPNPGAMLGLARPGAEVWLSRAAEGRKLPFGLEIERADGVFVGINTNRANALVAEALAAGAIAELRGYGAVRREVPYGRNSRIDFLLEGGGPPLLVEVKNTHLMRRPGLAEFPDCVTARGTKHLAELAAVAQSGGRAAMLYIVQRGDCDLFRVADDIDPAYAGGLAAARAAGVEVLCYACRVDPAAIAVERPLALALPPA